MTAKAESPIPAEEVSGLILAAGNGLRVGEGPKAFLRLGGKTLLEHVVALLAPYAGELIVGLPPDHLERPEAGQPVRRVAGGKTRQDTAAILTRLASRPFLVLQDVARPLTPRNHLEAALGLARDHGAVVTVRPARERDGVALRDGDHYGEAVPRDELILTQTPQVYRREILLEALRQAEAQGWQEISPAALGTKAGHRGRLIESATENLKITYPGDLERAETALKG